MSQPITRALAQRLTSRALTRVVLSGTLALAVLLALGGTKQAGACPMCKDTVGNNPDTSTGGPGGGPGGSTGPASGPPSMYRENGTLPAGFNHSTYLMLLSLFAVMGLVAYNLVRACRPGRRGSAHGFPVKQLPPTPEDKGPGRGGKRE